MPYTSNYSIQHNDGKLPDPAGLIVRATEYLSHHVYRSLEAIPVAEYTFSKSLAPNHPEESALEQIV